MTTWVRNNHTTLVALAGIFIFLSSVFISCDAKAQTTLEFKLLPPGHDGQVKGVGQARYYLLDEYLQLYQFDQELVKLRLDVKYLQGIVDKREKQLEEKDKEIKTLERDKDILATRGLRLGNDLDQCEKDKIELAGGPVWPYVVGIVGSVVGVIGGTIWAISAKDN